MGAFCLHGNLDTCEVCRRELETDDDYAPIPTTGFAHVLPRDWPTFWQSLTPAETAAALRAAPLVAEPWILYNDGWHRDTIRSGDGLSIAEAQEDGEWTVFGHDWKVGKAGGPDGAKAEADAHLASLGWVLLP